MPEKPKKIKFVTCVNPFNRADRDVKEIVTDLSLKEFIEANSPPLLDESTVLAWSINGCLIDESSELKDGDCLVCVPSVQGGGDSKNPLALIAGLVLSVFAIVAGPAVASWFGLVKGAMDFSIVAGLITGGIMMLGGSLLSNLFYKDTSGLNEEDRKTTYQWGSQQNVIGQGSALANTYGTVRIAGALLSQHIRTVPDGSGGSDSYLDMLFCGGEGPVDWIGNVEINGTPVSSFNDVQVQYRCGENTQSALTNFDEVAIDKFPGMTLAPQTAGSSDIAGNGGLGGIGGSVTKRISVSAGQSARVTLRTGMFAGSATFRVDYRPASGGSWTAFYSETVSDRNTNYGSGAVSFLTGGEYDIRVTLVSCTGGVIYFPFMREDRYPAYIISFEKITVFAAPREWSSATTDGDSGSILEATVNFPAGLFHVNDEGGYDATWAIILIQYRREGESAWRVLKTAYINKKQTSAFSVCYRINTGVSGRYTVRMGIGGVASADSTKYIQTASFYQLSHISPTTLTRPGKVLVGISIRATDQLSGSMPTITWMQRRTHVYVHDGNGWVKKDARNPAWICYDMAVHARNLDGVITVFGEKHTRMDYAAFAGWAAWNAKRLGNRPPILLNLYTDEIKELWSWLSHIGASGRGSVILRGTKLSCIWDEPQAVATQMFTVGNIVEGSLSGEFLGSSDRANAIEVSFLDENKKYERRQITVFGEEYNKTDAIPNVTSIYLYGVTNYELAYSEGFYRLLINEHMHRCIEIRASVDAIACQVGDVVDIQHDVPLWGRGGRTMPGSTASVIKLPMSVAMESGKSYVLSISTTGADGNIGHYERNVAPVQETTETDEITLTVPLPAAPMDFSNFAFGEAGKETKPFRVKSFSRDSDMMVTLGLTEYIPEVYTQNVNIPDINYSESPVIVTDVRLTEEGYRDDSGAHVILLTGTWKWTYERPSRFDVQWRADGGGWNVVAVMTEASYRIPAPEAGTAYQMRVRPYDSFGIAGEWVLSAVKTVSGNIDSIPPDVTGLAAAQSGEKIIVTGRYADIPDLSYIELRRNGSDWASSMPIGRYKFFPAEFLASLINDGSHAIRAKLVDNNGGESENDAVFVISVTGINRNKNVVLERDDCSAEHGGTASNLQWAGTQMYGGNATYDELYGENGTYNETDTYLNVYDLGSSYTSPVIDTFKVGLTGIMLDFWWQVYAHGNIRYSDMPDYTYKELGKSTYERVLLRHSSFIEIRLSDDNEEWSEWQEYMPGQYVFRYVQYRLTITRSMQGSVINITKLAQIYDVPDLDIVDNALSVPAEGLTVSFVDDYGTDFYYAPSEYAAYPSTSGVFADITDVTADGMTITCRTADGTAVADTVRLDVHGY